MKSACNKYGVMILFAQIVYMKIMISQRYAILYALAAVLCWSTVATAFKLTLIYLSPLQLILLSSLVSWLFFIIVLLWQGRFKDLFSLSKKDYQWSMIFGLMNPCAYYYLLFCAYDLLPAQEAQSINYSWAIVMSLLAVPLLSQRLSRYDIVAAIICYAGVLIIATKGNVLGLNFGNFKGVAFALASTLVWSLYWIYNQKDNREPILGLCLNFTVALPLLFIIAAINGELSAMLDYPWQAYFGGVYIGIFEMGLAFVLWLNAMKLADNTARIANLIFISPFLSLLFINVFLGEEILVTTLYGLILIIIGLIIQQRFSNRPNKH